MAFTMKTMKNEGQPKKMAWFPARPDTGMQLMKHRPDTAMEPIEGRPRPETGMQLRQDHPLSEVQQPGAAGAPKRPKSGMAGPSRNFRPVSTSLQFQKGDIRRLSICKQFL